MIAATGAILPPIKGCLTMQRNTNIEQTSEINKDFFVISQRVKQIFAIYCKYAKKSKKSCVFADFMGFFVKMQSPDCPPNGLLSFEIILQHIVNLTLIRN